MDLWAQTRCQCSQVKASRTENYAINKRFSELFAADGESLPQAVANTPVAVAEILQQLVANSAGDNSCADTPPFSVPWGYIQMRIDECNGDCCKALLYISKMLEITWSSTQAK